MGGMRTVLYIVIDNQMRPIGVSIMQPGPRTVQNGRGDSLHPSLIAPKMRNNYISCGCRCTDLDHIFVSYNRHTQRNARTIHALRDRSESGVAKMVHHFPVFN